MRGTNPAPWSGRQRLGALSVVGDPVGHSFSPMIHNSWIKDAGLDAVYVAYRLRSSCPVEDLRGLHRFGVHGLNITLPYKAAALDSATEATDTAARIGAANTLATVGEGWKAEP